MKTILITIAQENTKNAEAFQNLLEQVHSSLSGEKVSFEMIMFGQSIGFCITASSAVCSMLEGQIYAMNADMDIKIIPDPCEHISGYDIFSSCNLDLEKSDLLPIKTYTDFESDSLSGVLNVLSKVRPGEGAFLQIVTTPQDDSGWFHWKLKWRKSFFNFTFVFKLFLLSYSFLPLAKAICTFAKFLWLKKRLKGTIESPFCVDFAINLSI